MMQAKIFMYALSLILVVPFFTIWAHNGVNEKNMASTNKHGHSHNHVHDDEDHAEDENLVKLSQQQVDELGLQIDVAEPGILISNLAAHGKIVLHPNRLARIIPKVSGIAQEVLKNVGDSVKAGEILAVLETSEVADAKAAFLSALSKERLAASVLEREKKLYDEKVTSAQDFMTAKNLYEEAVINVQLAKQKLRAFGFTDSEISQLAVQKDPDLRLYPIRAPMEGTVIARNITKGEFVENNKTIYELADLNTVLVEVGIYPKDLYQVKVGQSVEVMSPTENQTTQAKLIFVSPIVTAETITAKAIAELDNSNRIWRPGTFVKVNITTGQLEVPILIPKQAVQTGEGRAFIFVMTPEGFERRFVQTGRSDRNNIEILSGLEQGEKYVANKTFILKAELGKKGAEHEH